MDSPPVAVRSVLRLEPSRRLLHVRALHLSDDAPYALEERWVDLDTVPALGDLDLARESANAWLVRNVPYTRGSFSLSATAADPTTADSLDCSRGEALAKVERTTWMNDRPITWVRLFYHPGYRLATEL